MEKSVEFEIADYIKEVLEMKEVERALRHGVLRQGYAVPGLGVPRRRAGAV